MLAFSLRTATPLPTSLQRAALFLLPIVIERRFVNQLNGRFSRVRLRG
jgi:hypothetical protein